MMGNGAKAINMDTVYSPTSTQSMKVNSRTILERVRVSLSIQIKPCMRVNGRGIR